MQFEGLPDFYDRALKSGRELERLESVFSVEEVSGLPDYAIVRTNGVCWPIKRVLEGTSKSVSIAAFGLALHYCAAHKMRTRVVVKAAGAKAYADLYATENIFDESFPRAVERSLLALALEETVAFKLLAQLDGGTANSQAMRFTPAALVELLNVKLAGYVPTTLIAPFRRVDFKAINTGRTVNERGRSEFGRDVEATVQSVERLPERINLSVPVFKSEVFEVPLTLNIDIDAASECFVCYLKSSDLDRQRRAIADWVFGQVEHLAKVAFGQVVDGEGQEATTSPATVEGLPMLSILRES